MCIVCEMKKAASNALGFEVKKEVLGKVPSGLILALSLAENEVEKVKADAEAAIASMRLAGVTKESALESVEEEYKVPFDEAVRNVKDSWDAIFNSVGATENENMQYRINQVTGELFAETLVNKQPTSPGVH